MQKLLIFLQQKYCELDTLIVPTRTINILTTNELVKLTTLNNLALFDTCTSTKL